MKLIDATVLKKNILKWLPPDPCGKEEHEFPYETDIVVSVLQEIDETPTEWKWTLCSERLPEDVEIGEEYPTLIYCTGGGKVDAGWYEAEIHKWWSLSSDATVDNVIAWMPLPAPYREDGE